MSQEVGSLCEDWMSIARCCILESKEVLHVEHKGTGLADDVVLVHVHEGINQQRFRVKFSDTEC